MIHFRRVNHVSLRRDTSVGNTWHFPAWSTTDKPGGWHPPRIDLSARSIPDIGAVLTVQQCWFSGVLLFLNHHVSEASYDIYINKLP